MCPIGALLMNDWFILVGKSFAYGRQPMEHPQPVLVIDLLPDIQRGLVDLLDSLSQDDWQRPIANSTWAVKDVALHLLGGDLGNLSRRRDGEVSRPQKS